MGCHVALTPTWSETATFADYVLPMGHATERHDTHSYETHAGRWLGFRQPVRRVAFEKLGRSSPTPATPTRARCGRRTSSGSSCPGGSTPTASLGIRRYFESPYRPGERVTVDEYYRWVFENRVPGLPEKAAAEGLTPLAYMRKYGVVEIAKDLYRQDERPLTDEELDGAVEDEHGVLRKPTDDESTPPLVGEAGSVGVRLEDGSTVAGWLVAVAQARAVLADAWRRSGGGSTRRPATSARTSRTTSSSRGLDEMVLIPTFRLPTLIHTRSGNAKYLNEISNTHPVWMHAADAAATRA